MTQITQLWRQFGGIAIPYWFSDEKWRARRLLVLLVALLLGQTWFSVLFNEQSGEFTSALAAQDSDRFWRSIMQCVGMLIVAVPVYAFYFYVRGRLGNYWRRWLTHRFVDNYFSDRAFYELIGNAEVDNPDQRISEDVNTFTQKSLYFLLIAVGAVLQLFAFSAVLWSISKMLVFFLIGYAIFGTLVTALVFGKVLIGLNYFQLKREANFRFSLIRIRENAESIALHGGEAHESRQVKRRFKDAFRNFNKLLRRQLNLNLFQYGYNFVTIILPSVIIAPQVMSGEMEVGRVIQAGGAFTAILSALTIIIDNFESLSTFAAGVDRLDVFTRSLAGEMPGQTDSGHVIETVESPTLALEHVTLQTPTQRRTLVKDLSVTIEPGQGLIIVGSSGSGKSSVLRAIAGLWNCGTGKIMRPSPDEMLFLPQRPYMIMGTLRDQLLYPNKDRKVTDEELCEILEQVNLPSVSERFGGLDVALDWAKILSVGEQQRLAFARVLLSKPRYAMLDEASSALDIGNEESLYRRLDATSTTLVSVGHRATLVKYHQQVLEVSGKGKWKLHPAKGFKLE